MDDVTRILNAIDRGDPQAAAELLPVVYDQLRRLAAHRIAEESPGQTFQATDLIHEAYLRLARSERANHWNSRGHFFAAAARAMRRILIENARRKQTIKHGGRMRRQPLDSVELAHPERSEMLLALDEALAKLAAVDPTKAQLVELRYFAGLTIKDTAQFLRISTTTAERYWNYARVWLHQEITKGGR